MIKVYILLLCFVLHPIANAGCDCGAVFTELQENFYRLYRVYWCQDIELDYNIKNYLENLIQKNYFCHDNSLYIDVESLREDTAYLNFNKKLYGCNEERCSNLLYGFYVFGYLPRNKNVIHAFLELLDSFIRNKQFKDGAFIDVSNLKMLLKEQKKVETVFRSL